MSSSLTGLQEKIFMDRYALKDTDFKNAKEGDTVIALVSEGVHAHNQFKEVGVIVGVDGDTLSVQVRDGRVLEVQRDKVAIAVESQPEQLWSRLSKALASVEQPMTQDFWTNAFAGLLDDWKLVPAGRIAAGAGVSDELTLFNCYVIPSPKDSRGGIMKSLSEMTEIMARGGGVGINLSSLRPKRALVAGVNGTSSGAVSWGGIFSYATGLIEQGGSRRGALMLMVNDWHPDVMDFITVKQKSGQITNANLSVCVSTAFMEAVKHDLEWTFKFPDTKHPNYNEEWNGDLAEWERKEYPVVYYKTIKAREMWQLIVESAWKSAEPGIVFTEYYNDVSNSWYFNPIICTNPCGEQGLPAWGVCNLSAINLSKFYDEVNHDVDWEELKKTVSLSVRFLDNVIDKTPYHFQENKDNQKNERRVGLGTMGLAELMIKLHIRYGSSESLTFIDKLFGFMAVEAYKSSVDIAEEKGAFPAFDANKFRFNEYAQKQTFGGMIFEQFDAEYQAKFFMTGIRNVTILTQAPTGSTGTMVGTSTGIEPYFAFEYFRESRLGTDKQYVPIAQEWAEAHPGEDLPEWFVTSMDMTAEDHVRVQAAIQKWVDSSISKTANAPSDFTIEDTGKLYQLAYDLGCKGVTIYRDGSRDVQVLNTIKKEEVAAPVSTQVDKRPQVLEGKTLKTETAFGTAYVTINENAEGDIDEMFLKLGKTGADIAAIADGLAIAITGALSPRIQSRPASERVAWIIDKLKGISGANTVGFGPNKIESLPDAIAKALLTYLGQTPVHHTDESVSSQSASTKTDLCPACGSASLVKEEGCHNCHSCGFSKCG